jgi:hypothetical protein
MADNARKSPCADVAPAGRPPASTAVAIARKVFEEAGV